MPVTEEPTAPKTIEEEPTSEKTPKETAKSEDEKKFSQKDLDDLISKRLKEERNRAERERAEEKRKADEAARIASLEGEEKLRAEYEAKLADVQKNLADKERALGLSRAEAKLASAGLPTEFAESVLGADDEATDARIAKLSELVNARVSEGVSAGLKHGTPPAGGASPTDPAGAELDRIMGIKR